jgi:hypothetical protein
MLPTLTATYTLGFPLGTYLSLLFAVGRSGCCFQLPASMINVEKESFWLLQV